MEDDKCLYTICFLKTNASEQNLITGHNDVLWQFLKLHFAKKKDESEKVTKEMRAQKCIGYRLHYDPVCPQKRSFPTPEMVPLFFLTLCLDKHLYHRGSR